MDDGNQPNSEAELRPGVEDDHTTSEAEPAAAKPGTTAVLSTCANLGKLVVDQAKTPTVLMGTIGAVAGGIIAGPLGAAAGKPPTPRTQRVPLSLSLSFVLSLCHNPRRLTLSLSLVSIVSQG